MTDVITGLSLEHDSVLSPVLDAAPGVNVVRRCVDLAELLSVAQAGIGQVCVVSAGLRGLDLSSLGQLRDAGHVVIGIHEPRDEAGQQRLRQLGVVHLLGSDATSEAVEQLVQQAAAPQRPAPSPHSSPGTLGGSQDPFERAPRPGANAAAHGGTDDTGSRPGGIEDVSLDLPADPGSVPGDGAGNGTPTPGPDDDEADLDGIGEEREPGTVVTVWGPHGAPGRSTVAVNLAACLARRGRQVLLVDADTYGGSVAQLLGVLDEAPGVAAATRAAEHGGLDLPVLARISPVVMPGLRVLTGLPQAHRWPELRPDALERVLSLARLLADVVVVDVGFNLEDDEELSYDTLAPRRNGATLTALAGSDTVVALGLADPIGLQRFVRALNELGTVPSGTVLPVVNRVRASAVGSGPSRRVAEALARFAGLSDVLQLPDDTPAVDAAVLAGRSVVEQAPGSAFTAAIGALAEAVDPRRGDSGTGAGGPAGSGLLRRPGSRAGRGGRVVRGGRVGPLGRRRGSSEGGGRPGAGLAE